MALFNENHNVRQSDDSSGDGNRSLRRGLLLLEAVLRTGTEGARVVDLCSACGLQRATVYRLLATLLEAGYIAPHSRWRYVAGPRGQALMRPAADDLAARLQPVLARVSAGCGEPSFAIVREGRISHCIARQIGTQPVQVLVVEVGRRQPLGVGAAGLALLAALPPEESAALLASNAHELPHYGGMTPERLKLLMAATRERGWSVVGNHVIKGALAVGLAVRSAGGTPVAAISVVAPLDRMPRQRQQLIVGLIREALEALLPDGL